MFLKSLTMKGFKSFADPTVLELEPGITVVVGPNGSGKSNVVDAVTWVLGAQGPRSLRSQKMEDVIFAGTSTRPALGRAEVSLTIDNSSGRLPVDMAEVTITRVLFRSGDSEYAINGMPCRLLDVQELLSDSGVGRQQHMIIGQGQLDGVLSARPEDRRAVIEEAAGVLKHRRRRERAERRLASTQENLERLGDLVREVRRQIRPLERQAAATRLHAQLETELRAIRLYLAGQELAELAARHGEASGGLRTLGADQASARRELASLDDQAQRAAADLSSRRQGDLATTLGRVQGLTERARGTLGVLRERSRSLAAALDAAADTDVVSTLEAEAARLQEDMGAAQATVAELEPSLHALRQEEGAARDAERAVAERHAQAADPADALGALAAARDRAVLLGRTLDQHRAAYAEFERRAGALEHRSTELSELETSGKDRLATLEQRTEGIERAAAAATVELEAARAELAPVEVEARDADEHRHRTAARSDALARALAELEGSSDRSAVAEVPGVAGVLADLVEVDPGWEAAFEAAGPSPAAVVTEGRDVARTVLERLRSAGSGGSVLATVDPSLRPRPPVDVPAGATAVRAHVHARSGISVAGLDAMLDDLLAGAICVDDWRRAVDLALDHPDWTVVTQAGDRFSARGWRVRSGSPVVTRDTVARAATEAIEAAEAAQEVRARLAAARVRLELAQDARRASDRAFEAHRAQLADVAAGVERARADLDRDSQERTEAQRALADAEQRRTAASAELDEITASLPEMEAAANSATADEAARQAERDGAASAWRSIQSRRHQLEVDLAGAEEACRLLASRLGEIERRLSGHAEERAQAAVRRQRLEAEATAVRRLEAEVDGARATLEGLLASVRASYDEQVEAVRLGGERLEGLRRRRHALEQRLEALGTDHQRVQLELSELTMRAQRVTETVEQELDSDPEAAVAAPCPEVPEGVTPQQHAVAVSERLGSVGPVNPLALDELSVLEERHQELSGQVEDVQTARRELHQVIRHLDEEIMSTFASAMADVNEHFSSLVALLFPGGTGRLELTTPDDLLNTGVEVEVRPLGRNVRRVSLLSGGERSLVALAFLFAIFRSRPSPFYLMDEVEAALDDVNLHRFLALVREFREEAQLIIVSHQKRTMETGDALYGVTMAPGGSSQVVSQKVERMAEPEAPEDPVTGAPAPAVPR